MNNKDKTEESDIELLLLLKNMKLKDNKLDNKMLEKIKLETSLERKCILYREYCTPQSTSMESIILQDLQIGVPIDTSSGDGCKNKINYEIKYSGHARMFKLNFVQIRPDHNIDYYILIGYNMYYDDILGKCFVFKIPATILYQLIVEYGGYAHGTQSKLGKITIDNLKGRNCEYALRCNPNARKKTKQHKLWCFLLKYETEYNHINF